MSAEAAPRPALICDRFRGYLPVIVDLETGGFNCRTDALLEIAAVTVEMDEGGWLRRSATWSYHVQPFEGANLEPAALEVTGIDPFHPLRPAIPERDALQHIFREVRRAVRAAGCTRAVLTGHNAHFDLGFMTEAILRTGIKRSPFHPFTLMDTASLCGVVFGHTVLSQAALAAGMPWDADAAHSAVYDAERTADLFCAIVNRFRPIYDSVRTNTGAPADALPASIE